MIKLTSKMKSTHMKGLVPTFLACASAYSGRKTRFSAFLRQKLENAHRDFWSKNCFYALWGWGMHPKTLFLCFIWCETRYGALLRSCIACATQLQRSNVRSVRLDQIRKTGDFAHPLSQCFGGKRRCSGFQNNVLVNLRATMIIQVAAWSIASAFST